MNLTEVRFLVEQRNVPKLLQTKVVDVVTVLLKEEKDVEVIVNLSSITVDIYDERGNRVDTMNFKYNSADVVHGDKGLVLIK